jgi:hypothetical protein
LKYHDQGFIRVFKKTIVPINPMFTISAIYNLRNVSLDRSFDVLRLDRDVALAHGSVDDNIQGTDKGVAPRSLLVWVEEALEGLCLEQRTPKIKPELGCALFKLFNQIAYLRDPWGSITDLRSIANTSQPRPDND